jgi:predicted nucleotidyltransferase component of viral defense system
LIAANISLQEILETRAHFGLPSPALVEKDILVVRAIAVLTKLNAAPFALVFGGGTALARAHKLVRRMSEDVDFKVVPTPATPVSRSALRRERGTLRDRVTAALLSAGFDFDPKDSAEVRSRDENSYTIYQLPYSPLAGNGQALRPAIQVELNHTLLRRAPVMLPVSSFVAEAMNRTPEVPGIACAGLDETAAEKLVSLTRRTAMELAGVSRAHDPALVRHIYDLHMIREHLNMGIVAELARDIAAADAEEFGNQHSAYETDIPGETRKALEAFRNNPLHRQRYDGFLADMVYGEKPEFDEALATVITLAETALISNQSNGTFPPLP